MRVLLIDLGTVWVLFVDNKNMAHKNLIWNTEISHETLKSHMEDKNLTCNIETSYETQKMRSGRRQRRRPGPFG